MVKNEQGTAKKKPWPVNCPWPEPTAYGYDYDEDTAWGIADDETQELLEIKEYFDSLVDSGRLNEDYSLNEDYEGISLDEDEEAAKYFIPEKGEDYWDDGFDVEAWREDLSEHVNLLRIAPMDPHKDPVIAMRSAFSYEFNNENLLRQAFTRRSFQIEHGLSGCSEELEFLGDTILSTVVTREILRQFSVTECLSYEAPFESKYNEGELTRIRQQFTSKEALAARARELGLGRFILFCVPKNDKGVHTIQQLNCDGETRSKARENAARRAYEFIVRNGLWKNLSEAGIVPDLENSINQLQELYQKKYLEEKPEYEYDDRGNEWFVDCRAEGYFGWGAAKSKVKAKKKAAYMVIVNMLISAGICEDEWHEAMLQNMTSRE